MTDTTATGPMHGIKVIDLSIALAGPYPSALLADQGADVVKVERPGIGDLARWVGVAVNGVSALFHMSNRGKRSIAIDLQRPEGVDIVRRLAADADVLVQNFRPGVLDRLGLGYDDLRALNPRLIYCSVSGFGATGPYAHKGAYDTVIQAYGGLAVNEADATTGAPRFMNQTAADKVSALYAAQAITAALFARERGAGGQHVEVAMLDAVAAFLWADAAGNEVLTESDGSMKSSFSSGFAPFRFTDGWGICTPTSDADFAGMCRAFDVSGPDVDEIANIMVRRASPDKSRLVMDRCYAAAATMSTDEAIGRLEAENVPCGRVLSAAELVDDPHAVATELFDVIEHPRAGVMRRPRHPARFAATPAVIGGACPGLGEHTDEVLTELGVDADTIASLRAEGIVS